LHTAQRLAAALDLAESEWVATFQSRFGPSEWLQPYTDVTLESLASDGVQSVGVICPGFAADCLETLEEIAQEGWRTFLDAGGRDFHYIPALNDRPDHIRALSDLLLRHLPHL
jgi:ferrochelatase